MSFDSWWKARYDAPEKTEGSHAIRYADVQRELFWLNIFLILSHEAAHVFRNHQTDSGPLNIAHELEADRIAIAALVEIGNDPAQVVGSLASMRYASSIIHRSTKSPIDERVQAIAAEQNEIVRQSLNDPELWKMVTQYVGEATARAMRDNLNAASPLSGMPAPPWELRR